MHKGREPNSIPLFHPIVSSIGTYNHELAKYLCILLGLGHGYTFMNRASETELLDVILFSTAGFLSQRMFTKKRTTLEGHGVPGVVVWSVAM